jgi:hypothetical protein
MRDNDNASNRRRIRTLTVDSTAAAGPYSAGDYVVVQNLTKAGIRTGDTAIVTAMGTVAGGVFASFGPGDTDSIYWGARAVIVYDGQFELMITRLAGNVAPVALPSIRWRVTFIRP